MPTLSVKPIYNPRKTRYCGDCGNIILNTGCVRFYGMAHMGEKPYNLYLCVRCAMTSGERAIKAAQMIVDKLYSELCPIHDLGREFAKCECKPQ